MANVDAIGIIIYIYIDYMGYIGEDDNGKCGRYWDNYIYILIIWDT